MSLSFLVEFLSASLIRLIVSASFYFIPRSSPHADHPCNAKPSVIGSDYLFITMNMPQRCDFDPRPAALWWMEEKGRRTRESARVGKQECFTTVFANEDTEEKEVRETVLKRKF